MKKIIISVLAITLFSACSQKTEDYLGVHDFKVMTQSTITDTTEIQASFFKKSYLKILFYKLSSFKVDIYEEGDRISGTCSFYSVLKHNPSGKLENQSCIKADLKNIHIVNDTLVADLHMLTSMELKLAKAKNTTYLIIQKLTSSNQDDAEKCNAFAKVDADKIVYKSNSGSNDDVKSIIESNNCSINNKVKEMLENGYNIDKKEYLKSILLRQNDDNNL